MAYEGVLANVPGLAGYMAQQDSAQQQQTGQLSQIGQLMQIQKLMQDNALQAQLPALMKGAGNDPARIEAIGLYLAERGHPGGATFLTQAEKMRALQEQAKTAQAFKSSPPILGSAEQGPPQQLTPPSPGLMGPLMASPYVGDAATAFQSKIDQGQMPVPTALTVFNHLQQQHMTAQNAQTARDEKPITQAPLVSVPDGKGGFKWATRESAIGQGAPLPAGERVAANQQAAQLDPASLKVAAWEKLLFGTDPKGMGTASSMQRKQIADERARMGADLGLSPQEIAMLPQDNKIKMKAVDGLTKWGTFVAKSSDKLERDLDVAISYAEKLPLGQMQSLNKAVLMGKKEFNDTNANAYASAINSVRVEYARMMAGPTSNAMLPVEAMKTGNELLSRGVNVAALKEVGVQMKRDAANTIIATNDQIGSLRGSLLGGPGIKNPVNAPNAKGQVKFLGFE